MTPEEASAAICGKKIALVTPMYGGQCAGVYAQGLLQTSSFLSAHGVGLNWIQMSNESLIPRGRNELARRFLEETDADYLMFVDADIAFGPQAVAQLMAADKQVVGALYPKKEINWDRVKQAARDGDIDNLESYAGSFVFNTDTGKDPQTDDVGCVEVRHVGTGFMLIRRDVLEQLKPKVPVYRRSSIKVDGEFLDPETSEFFATRIDDSGAYLSEDYDFCELCRDNGISVWVNPFIQLGHWGTYLFEGDILKSGGKRL